MASLKKTMDCKSCIDSRKWWKVWTKCGQKEFLTIEWNTLNTLHILFYILLGGSTFTQAATDPTYLNRSGVQFSSNNDKQPLTIDLLTPIFLAVHRLLIYHRVLKMMIKDVFSIAQYMCKENFYFVGLQKLLAPKYVREFEKQGYFHTIYTTPKKGASSFSECLKTVSR